VRQESQSIAFVPRLPSTVAPVLVTNCDGGVAVDGGAAAPIAAVAAPIVHLGRRPFVIVP